MLHAEHVVSDTLLYVDLQVLIEQWPLEQIDQFSETTIIRALEQHGHYVSTSVELEVTAIDPISDAVLAHLKKYLPVVHTWRHEFIHIWPVKLPYIDCPCLAIKQLSHQHAAHAGDPPVTIYIYDLRRFITPLAVLMEPFSRYHYPDDTTFHDALKAPKKELLPALSKTSSNILEACFDYVCREVFDVPSPPRADDPLLDYIHRAYTADVNPNTVNQSLNMLLNDIARDLQKFVPDDTHLLWHYIPLRQGVITLITTLR